MKRSFNQYTDAELLTLDNETINDAIRIEAIERGVNPPILLSEALRKSEFRGYTKPQEAVPVFEIMLAGKYSGEQSTGVGYLSQELAEKALDGMVMIEHDTYSADKGYKFHSNGATVAKRLCGVSKSEQAWTKLEQFKEDTTKFNEVSDECVNRLSAVRQADYNRRVNTEKKAEYLRLAGGDEAIAKGFWAKVERTEWPSE